MYSSNTSGYKTLFAVMPEWQALSFLRDRVKAFSRLLEPQTPALPTEFVLTAGVVHLFADGLQADAFGQEHLPHGYAIVHIQLPNLQKQGLILQGHLKGTAVHPQTGKQCWACDVAGVQALVVHATVLVGTIAYGRPTGQPQREMGGPTGFGGC